MQTGRIRLAALAQRAADCCLGLHARLLAPVPVPDRPPAAAASRIVLVRIAPEPRYQASAFDRACAILVAQENRPLWVVPHPDGPHVVLGPCILDVARA